MDKFYLKQNNQKIRPNKALDIVSIDLEGKSSIADYMIIASETSSDIYKLYQSKFMKN